MGIIDWIILAVLLFLAIRGFLKGFATTVVHILGTVATFFLIGQVYPLLRNFLISNYKINGTLATTIAVLLFLMMMAVVVGLLVWLLNKVIKAIRLSALNKSLGFVLGLVHGLLIVIVAMTVLDFLPKLSKPLQDPVRHKVYYRVHVIKDGIFANLNLKQRDKYFKLLEREKKETAKS